MIGLGAMTGQTVSPIVRTAILIRIARTETLIRIARTVTLIAILIPTALIAIPIRTAQIENLTAILPGARPATSQAKLRESDPLKHRAQRRRVLGYRP
ncbi:MAG: hypothetical protein AAGG56_18105 [Pseudomonadota bacterium]